MTEKSAIIGQWKSGTRLQIVPELCNNIQSGLKIPIISAFKTYVLKYNCKHVSSHILTVSGPC